MMDAMCSAGAAPNEHSASNLILRMAELTLIDMITQRR
jgi:hypothetical protein